MSGNAEISPLRFHDFTRSAGKPRWSTTANAKTLADLVFDYDVDDLGAASEQQKFADQQERAAFDLSQDLLSKTLCVHPTQKFEPVASVEEPPVISVGKILRMRGSSSKSSFEMPHADLLEMPWAYGLPGSGEKPRARSK